MNGVKGQRKRGREVLGGGESARTGALVSGSSQLRPLLPSSVDESFVCCRGLMSWGLLVRKVCSAQSVVAVNRQSRSRGSAFRPWSVGERG